VSSNAHEGLGITVSVAYKKIKLIQVLALGNNQGA
jgi:hypothetical protein